MHLYGKVNFRLEKKKILKQDEAFCGVEMLKTFSVTAGLPPSLQRARRKVSKSDKQRRKGACLSGCQSANKSQSSSSSPTGLSLFEDPVMCSLTNPRQWKQSPRPLCLTVEEEKGRGENPQLQGFHRLQR